MGTILKGKSIWFEPQNKQKRAKKESSWFEESRCKVGFNSRIQFASNESKLVLGNWTLIHYP
jgi:hypothetical protein